MSGPGGTACCTQLEPYAIAHHTLDKDDETSVEPKRGGARATVTAADRNLVRRPKSFISFANVAKVGFLVKHCQQRHV